MIHKRTDKVWHNHRGTSVPREYVPDFDKRNETVVARIYGKADKLSRQLKSFKEDAFNEADKLYSLMLKNAKIEESKRKGNYTLSSFDKSVKIEVNVSDRIEFDDNIEFAQAKFSEFIALKTDGADKELAELVNHAFSTRKGKLDTKRVLSLFSYKITHPVWLEGLEFVKKSMSSNSSVRYMEISAKDKNGEYQTVKLNFSSI
jgi:uncharacterized protein DUF3164